VKTEIIVSFVFGEVGNFPFLSNLWVFVKIPKKDMNPPPTSKIKPYLRGQFVELFGKPLVPGIIVVRCPTRYNVAGIFLYRPTKDHPQRGGAMGGHREVGAEWGAMQQRAVVD